jgi:hypothetical protein
MEEQQEQAIPFLIYDQTSRSKINLIIYEFKILLYLFLMQINKTKRN